MIDEKPIIDRITKNIDEFIMNHPDKANCLEVETMREFVDTLELAKKYSWIPCSERLPEDIDDVLVWYKARFNGGTCSGENFEYYGLGYYRSKDGWSVTGVNKSIFGKPEVIAWMPLPETYKG